VDVDFADRLEVSRIRQRPGLDGLETVLANDVGHDFLGALVIASHEHMSDWFRSRFTTTNWSSRSCVPRRFPLESGSTRTAFTATLLSQEDVQAAV